MTDTDLPLARPSTGRAAGPVGGVLLVVEHYWTWYRRNWRATAVSSVLQPLLFLLAFGVGFGTLVDGTGRAGAATGGLDYLVWLAPALLCRVGGAERRRSSRPTRCSPASSGSALPRHDGRPDRAPPRSRSGTSPG